MNAQLSFAFAAGIIATVNPCGFAMLPAYLSFFLGLEGGRAPDRADASMRRAMLTGATVSAGFLSVFAVVGVLVAIGLALLRDIVPWLAIGIGVALVVLGIAVLSGVRLQAVLPKLERGGTTRELRSLYLFGVSYAIASVSCGLPTFIVVVSTSTDSFGASVASFGAYTAGMTLVLMALTVSLASARTSFVGLLRRLLPYVDRLAGLLMVLAGLYMIWFWIAERTGRDQGGAVREVESWSASIANWIDQVGATRIGIVCSIVLALAAIVALRRGRPEPASSTTA